MTKIELITALAQKGNCTRKQADDALELVTSVIVESLIAGEKV
ncbi:MAG: HU family DNA-binding protein, partial [Oscillospiraceae bacterium]|nr:HU family DNA-binding protein [Oscillospiraceae bacterium]